MAGSTEKNSNSSTADRPSVPKTNAELAERPTIYASNLLEGKIVFISGGGSGIGRATAWLAARLGAQVVIAGRKEEKLVKVVNSINKISDLRADYRVLDIREFRSVQETLSQVTETLGPIDILVNSAGGQFPQPALDFSEKGWRTVIETNLNGTWNMMHTAAGLWREHGRSGSIVNIVVVNQGLFGVGHTSAARAGVIAFSEKASVEWAPYKIRVNCIGPGAIETEGWSVYSESARSKYPASNPSMRPGSPWEVAEAVIFLGGPGGLFINGATLILDGGGQHWGEVWTTGKPNYYRQASRKWDND